MLKIKNVYAKPEPTDGARILIERLWPQNVDVYTYRIDQWLKDLAPSYHILEWLRNHPKEWGVFKRTYLDELNAMHQKKVLADVGERAKKETLTLLYAVSDFERSMAKIVYELLRA